jgi:hypothetical protein
MDDDDSEQNKKTKRKKGTSNVLQRYVAYVSDVLSPIWLRRFIQINDGNNWFILGCRYNFLFNFRVLLVILYITYEALIK